MIKLSPKCNSRCTLQTQTLTFYCSIFSWLVYIKQLFASTCSIFDHVLLSTVFLITLFISTAVCVLYFKMHFLSTSYEQEKTFFFLIFTNWTLKLYVLKRLSYYKRSWFKNKNILLRNLTTYSLAQHWISKLQNFTNLKLCVIYHNVSWHKDWSSHF